MIERSLRVSIIDIQQAVRYIQDKAAGIQSMRKALFGWDGWPGHEPNRHAALTSRCERPAALPTGLPEGVLVNERLS